MDTCLCCVQFAYTQAGLTLDLDDYIDVYDKRTSGIRFSTSTQINRRRNRNRKLLWYYCRKHSIVYFSTYLASPGLASDRGRQKKERSIEEHQRDQIMQDIIFNKATNSTTRIL